jgi:hypothetical protein
MVRIAITTLAIVVISAGPASADPTPSPTAPPHVATACVNVLGHNPQTQGAPTQAPQAQANFLQVGEAFCGL